MNKAEGGVEFDAYNEDHITAQVVIDAMRFALASQHDEKERMRIVDTLLEWAPEVENDHGIELIRRMVVDQSLTVVVTG